MRLSHSRNRLECKNPKEAASGQEFITRRSSPENMVPEDSTLYIKFSPLVFLSNLF